jgi:carbon monoxide dehydrogenase subunit G
MHFEHQIAVAASPSEVWDFLWRAEEVGACLPGCREVRTLAPHERYEATIEERVGPFRAHFDWEITIEEQDPERQVRLAARGKDSKLGATARAEMLVRLDGNKGSGTRLDIGTELSIAGKVATLGQVVIKRKADQVVSEFARALRERLDAGGGQHDNR